MTRDLVNEARREGKLVGKMKVAIDQTKGHPWTGHVESDKDESTLNRGFSATRTTTTNVRSSTFSRPPRK
ncbi:hypothetical protein [Haloarcula argentinensis]|uniref:hypothetical protein n=1 Tax=Haloarcula argentinensis TaxID=43776 RepID=UPI00147382ED|nr:hypothetical protein [Haloarcula argentinensis]